MNQQKQASCLTKLPEHKKLTESLKKKGVGKSLKGIRASLDAKLKGHHDKEYLKSRGL